MTGDIDTSLYAIKNVPVAIDDQDPITNADLEQAYLAKYLKAGWRTTHEI